MVWSDRRPGDDEMLRDLNDFAAELRMLIRARYPLVQIATHEEDRALAALGAIATELNKKLIIWSASRGVHNVDGSSIDRHDLVGKVEGPFPAAAQAALSDLASALELFERMVVHKDRHKGGYLFVFLDPYPYLSQPAANPIYRRKLRDLVVAIRSRSYHANCLVISQSNAIPEELEKEITIIDLPLPSRAEIEAHVSGLVARLKPNRAFEVDPDPALVTRMVDSAIGLTMAEIGNCLSKAIVDDMKFDDHDVQSIFLQKQQIVRKSGILEYIDARTLSLDDVGGLDQLKLWLTRREAAFSSEGRSFGIAAPKGVLVTGVPGCGKSLSAKSVAATWKLPLIHLDMGKVFSSLVGSSENRMREAIQVCEAVAPCVLWIDEIEKGLPRTHGYVGDSGTSLRVLATFLTWLQEKESPVFVFATANAIEYLPPEALRKGRFDEIFFVDLPNQEERREIIEIHIRRGGRDPASFDLDRLAAMSGPERFGADVALTGAEINSWVNEALIAAFQRRRHDGTETDLSMTDLETALERIVPLAKMRQTEITAMRRWADEHATRASSPEEQASTNSNLLNIGGRQLDL
jgi:ATP-dependent 26S proteasome regulatory subunit